MASRHDENHIYSCRIFWIIIETFIMAKIINEIY